MISKNYKINEFMKIIKLNFKYQFKNKYISYFLFV